MHEYEKQWTSAAIMDMPLGTIKSHILRGKENLNLWQNNILNANRDLTALPMTGISILFITGLMAFILIQESDS